MNEVILGQLLPSTSGGASSKGTLQPQSKVNGNVLPEADATPSADPAPKVQKVTAEALRLEVEKVNDFVQTVQRDLQFTVDEDLDRTVIRVVDSESGELIRQIPDDIFLELARRLKEDGEVNLFSAIG